MTTEIKPEVRALADKFKANLEYDHRTAADGTITATFKEGTFANTLPEGVTVGQFSACSNHISNVLPAGRLAVGEAASEAFTKHKNLEAFQATLPTVGRDAAEFKVARETTGRNPRDGTETKSWLRTTGAYDIYASGNRGENKKVSADLAALGEKALAPKK